jgi:predicted RNA-binding Zn ribbon-like protein
MLPDPGGRAPAPWPLRAVQVFVNTLDTENGIEELGSPETLRDVLVRIGVLDEGTAVGARDLEAALEVREALRRLALANNGLAVDAEATATLERASRAAQLSLRFDGDRSELVAGAPGVDGALGSLVAIVHAAMLDGSWRRLKACRRDICLWLYYDRSRNASSTWCAMSVCGNRTKTKRYRRRHAA